MGATTDSQLGTGSIIRATLSQSDAQVTGTWESPFPTLGFDDDHNGTLSGSVNGLSVSATFTISGIPGVCSFSVLATLNSSGTQMVGTYAEMSCSVAVLGVVTSGGSIALTKQQAASSANVTGPTVNLQEVQHV